MAQGVWTLPPALPPSVLSPLIYNMRALGWRDSKFPASSGILFPGKTPGKSSFNHCYSNA